MMTYALLNTLFLVGVGLWLAIHIKQCPRPILFITLGILLVLTLIFDSLFILLGIFEYNPNNILGIYIWKAPIEDFAYTIASVFMVGLLWEYYETKNSKTS